MSWDEWEPINSDTQRAVVAEAKLRRIEELRDELADFGVELDRKTTLDRLRAILDGGGQ